MKIKSKTMLGVSLFAMTFSFSVTAQTCKPVPTCAELGYTETSCSGDSLKCPFDTSKMYCLPVVPHSCNSSETKVGDIYYSDDTCSSEVVSGKTPIGVVFDTDRKLVVSLVDEYQQWNDGSSTMNDIPGLKNFVTKGRVTYAITADNDSRLDTNGKSNTDIIMAYAASSGQTHKAAKYCHDMTTGNKTWYLPAYGELMLLENNFSTVNASESKVGTGYSAYYWSSTEGVNSCAAEMYLGAGMGANDLKSHNARVRCVFSYK